MLQWTVPYTTDGLEALIFTADGDMRQALNNLQATFAGFGSVNPENVFKVHPFLREIDCCRFVTSHIQWL